MSYPAQAEGLGKYDNNNADDMDKQEVKNMHTFPEQAETQNNRKQ